VLKKLLKEVRLLLWHVQEWARRWIYHVTSMAVRERGRRRGLVWCRMDCLGGRPDGSREGNVSALAAREPPHLVDSTGSTYPSYSMNILYLTASSNLCPLTKHQYNMGGHLSSRLRHPSKRYPKISTMACIQQKSNKHAYAPTSLGEYHAYAKYVFHFMEF
jgi:hypothetical protein